tara:strand:- start:1146 stop:1280 length:135 start_codon:yes stop_codon:yes gene_type:complete
MTVEQLLMEIEALSDKEKVELTQRIVTDFLTMEQWDEITDVMEV